MKPIKKIFTLFLFSLIVNSYGQQVRVDAVLDTSRMRIGEQAKIDIYVTYNSKEKDIKIQWPDIADTLTGKVEVVSVSQIDTTLPDKTNSTKIFQHQQIIVSVYDSGYFAVPGFKFVLNNDTAHPLYTNPLFLEVHTVPTDTSDTKLKDIKAPFEEKFNWKWYVNYIYWGVAVLVLLLATMLITRYYVRKKNKVDAEPEKPKVPAHILALAALEKIKQEQIWKEGKVKEYYSSISETTRAYIEDRFNVHALESTTDEIMLAFRSQVVDKDSKDKLQQLLTLSDLVKFAKMFPIEDEHNFTLQNAFDFVNGTKREEEIQITDDALVAEQLKANNKTETLATETIKPQNADTYIPGAGESAPKIKKIYNNDVENSLRENRIAEGKRRFRMIKIVALILGSLLVLFFVASSLFFSDKPLGVVEEVTNSINKMCPVMADSETRLDNVSAIDEKTVQFNYTFVNLAENQINVNAVNNEMQAMLLKRINTDTQPQMEALKSNQTTLKYSYSDKTGKFLFSVEIKPEDYNTYN